METLILQEATSLDASALVETPALPEAAPPDIPEPMNFEARQAIDKFLFSRQVENCSPRTIESYEERLVRFFKFIRKAPREVEKSDIEFYLMDLRKTPTPRGGTRSPFYIKGHYVALRCFFNWAVREEAIPKTPLTTMRAPKTPRYAKGFIQEDQFKRLLSVCPTDFVGRRSQAWLWLLWSTGARFSEIANLQLSDLDWNAGRIKVTGKGSRERFIPFTTQAQKAVYAYIKMREDRYPHLWISEERRPLRKWAMSYMTHCIFERAADFQCDACGRTYLGVEFTYRRHVCPTCERPLRRAWDVRDKHHIFRRSWAKRQLQHGTPLKTVQLVGGWESVSVLEQYVRAMESDDAFSGSIEWV